ALAGTSAVAGPFFLALMKTTTTTKIIAAVVALLITSGAIHYCKDLQTAQPKAGAQPAALARARASQPTADVARPPAAAARPLPPALRPSVLSAEAPRTYDQAALKAAREKQEKFWQRIDQLALMGDPLKVQELLLSEYGIRLSVDEIRTLQERGQKGFRFGVVELWASNQPQEALAWAASAIAEPNVGGGD